MRAVSVARFGIGHPRLRARARACPPYRRADPQREGKDRHRAIERGHVAEETDRRRRPEISEEVDAEDGEGERARADRRWRRMEDGGIERRARGEKRHLAREEEGEERP